VAALTPQVNDTSRFSQRFCTDWRDQQIRHIVEMKPAVVVMSSYIIYGVSTEEMLDGWAKSLSRLKASGAKLVYVRDTPKAPRDMAECVSSAFDDWSRCTFKPVATLDPVVTGALQGALSDLVVIDLNGYLCVHDVCPAVRNGLLLYRDDTHLTNTAAKALAPAFGKALDHNGI
jgi:hypothetical protein